MDTSKCNVFQYCKFLLYCGYSMVLIVLFMVVVSYYAVVVQSYGPYTFNSGALGILFGFIVIIFTALIGMLLWSYFACVIASPGHVPSNWHPFQDQDEAQLMLERLPQLSLRYDRSDPMCPRYCRKCSSWKPPRSHHDSVSQKCVLKMDHYCIWVVNCVGLLNYKFFVLFLFYAWVSCTIASGLLIYPMIQFFKKGGDAKGAVTLFGFVLDLAFSISLAGLIFMHWQMICQNRTSIEAFDKNVNPWPFDKGRRKNIEEVFGREFWRWWLPYYTEDEQRNLLQGALGQRLRAGILSSDGNV
eukprot:TRINITY_DN2838_c0_g1_i1.p1 TRINITY_DN2838_c0_g1~~TRINITY_DN2838_c0_g1_i1.p1  ORF type:complete len:348 (-),score=9.31 TRINITY_DN2838_c0_g1_i1:503-1402(-)